MRSFPKYSHLAGLLISAIVIGVFTNTHQLTYSSNLPSVVTSQKETFRLPKGIRHVTTVEGITEYQLVNGLRILLFPDPSKPTITINITYLVGSLHESYGETGMAHLLEHLLFKGSVKHPNIPKELTEHGASPNGSTWFDRTNYYETFTATDENLEWALDLEADRMINSFVAKRDLDSEMTVVRNEFENSENSPLQILIQRTLSTAFLWHNYGKSTIGARSDIENVSIDRLQTFYHKYYQPDNAVLLVAGRFDQEKTLALISKKFSSIPRPERILQQPYTSEPTQDGERSVTLRRVGDVQLLLAAYHIPAGSHPDFAALDVLTQVLADTPSGRLHKSLVETKKASSIFGFNFQLNDPGVTMLAARIRQEDSLKAARRILLETIENISNEPPTEKEVVRARTQLLKGIDLALNDANRIGLTLSEWVAMGDWRLFFLHRDRIKKVTLADVKRVAATYLKVSNRTLGQFIPSLEPHRAKIPAKPDIPAMLKHYTGDSPVSVGEAFDPSPNNIESRVQRLSIGPNLKVALLPKKTRGGSVFASINLHFGNEESLMHASATSELTGAMLMRGTINHTRQEIQDKFDQLKVRGQVFGSTTSATAVFETVKENLPSVLELVGEILRHPSFSREEFETLKEAQLANIEQQRNDPQRIVSKAFRRYLKPYPKGHVHYLPTFDEEIKDIKATKLEELKQFHKNFYEASQGEIGISGDFNAKKIAGILKKLFGDWKSPIQYKRVKDPYKEIAPINQSFETPDKANAVFFAGMVLPIRDDSTEYPALVLGNYMLGGGFLNSRLALRIRQKEGLSYGIRAYLGANSKDQRGSLTVVAITAPQNIEKLESVFLEELQRVLNDGFTTEELAAAKSGYLQTRQVNRAQDRTLAGILTSRLFQKRTLIWDEQFEKKIAALTNDEILITLRQYLDPAKLIIMKAGDFANAAKNKN